MRVRAVADHLEELRELHAVAVRTAVDAGMQPEDLDLRGDEVRDLLDQSQLIDAERRQWLRAQWSNWEEWPQDRIRDITTGSLPRG